MINLAATENRSVGGSIPPPGTTSLSVSVPKRPKITEKQEVRLGLASAGVQQKCWYICWYVADTNKPYTNRADANMILTDAKIRAAKPAARLVKLSDGGGLQLWITPDGAKRWRLAYRLAGAQKAARPHSGPTRCSA